MLVESEDNLEWVVKEETMSISHCLWGQLQYRVGGGDCNSSHYLYKFPQEKRGVLPKWGELTI